MIPFVCSAKFEGTGRLTCSDLNPLRNPYRVPVLVDRLHFTHPGVHYSDGETGIFLDVEAKLGRAQLTGGFVPLRGVAPLDTPQRLSTVWKMPRPIYLRPGASFQVQLVGVPSYIGGPVLSTWCDVSMVGRMLDPGAQPPAQVALPWVSKFEVPSTQTEAVASTTELINPFQTPLHATGILRVDAPARWGAVGAIPSLTVTNHEGKPVCRSSVATTSLFSARYNLWPVNCVLQPRQGFHLSFDEFADWNEFLMNSPFHLLGWRNASFSEVF